MNDGKKYIYGPEAVCTACGVTFRRRDKGVIQKTCSYACRGRAQTAAAMRGCASCGLQFLPKRPGRPTCSRACGTKYRLARSPKRPGVAIRKKMAVFHCGMIHRCRKRKTGKTAAILGYTVAELYSHLEAHFQPGMAWQNYGNKKGCWSIDHRRPISSFDPSASAAEVNALSNLRPMWHSENCSKQNKWKAQ